MIAEYGPQPAWRAIGSEIAEWYDRMGHPRPGNLRQLTDEIYRWWLSRRGLAGYPSELRAFVAYAMRERT